MLGAAGGEGEGEGDLRGSVTTLLDAMQVCSRYIRDCISIAVLLTSMIHQILTQGLQIRRFGFYIFGCYLDYK